MHVLVVQSLAEKANKTAQLEQDTNLSIQERWIKKAPQVFSLRFKQCNSLPTTATHFNEQIRQCESVRV